MQEESGETPPSGDRALRRRGVKNLLESDADLVCRSGFIYLPLLLDPSVAKEIEGNTGNPVVAHEGGRNFVRTLSLRSLVESYGSLCPDEYEELRRSHLNPFSRDLPPTAPAVSERLKTIIFSVMPHFVTRGRSPDRRIPGEEQFLDFVGRKLGIPGGSCEPARDGADPGSLRRILAALEQRLPAVEPPAEGVMPVRELGIWLSKALEARILTEERERLSRILDAEERLGAPETVRRRVLFAIAKKGALEIDGFGFLRKGPGDDYLIYKHTGEFALKDYYGRLYLFPDCRVAVFTGGTLRPFVVESYKHPFLEGHDSGQEICLRHRAPTTGFSGPGVIEALEEGINALLFGYSSRRRNGYHSLEGFPKRTGSTGFTDSRQIGAVDTPVRRTRHTLEVDFDDFRIPADHPGIRLGEVPITNNDLP